MNCSIEITNNGVKVRDNQKLFDSILEYTEGNTDSAIDIYGVTLADDFRNSIDIKKATLQDVLGFIEIDNKSTNEPLTKSESKSLLDLSVTNTEGEISRRLVHAFDVDGKFGIDESKLKESGLFSDSEISNMIQSKSYERYEPLYYKLYYSDSEIEPIKSDYILRSDYGVKINPDVLRDQLISTYVGVKSDSELWDRARELGDSIVLDNPELIPTILRDISNKVSMLEYEQDDLTGELSEKIRDSISTEMSNTFNVDQDFTDVIDDVDTFRSLPHGLMAAEFDMVLNAARELESKLNNKGINSVGFAETIANRSPLEITDYLDSVYNLIYDTMNHEASISESLDDFVESHRLFFGDNVSESNRVVIKPTIDGVYLHGEFNKPEVELYEEHEIVKYDQNIYRKISDQRSNDDLFDLILDIKPNLQTHEDVVKYLASKHGNLTTPNSDGNMVLRVAALKELIQSKSDIKKGLPLIKSNLNIHKFESDFYIKMLNNPVLSELMYISNRGIESRVELGEYTRNLLELELGSQMFDKLKDYATISGNVSLQNLTEQLDVDIDRNDPNVMRNYYANNIAELPKLNLDYIRDGNVIYSDSTDHFINVDNTLYEKVGANAYGEVKTNGRYINHNLSKPSVEFRRDVNLNPNKPLDSKSKIKKSQPSDEEIEFC